MTTQTMRIQKNSLTDLLKRVQRKHTVAGKGNVSQVESCVLVYEKDEVSVTSLPKDGVSSVARFGVKVNEVANTTCLFPVPSIDTLLGVLKFHGQSLRLTFDGEKSKMLIKSGKKQTTLATSLNAQAYSTSTDSLLRWSNKSQEIAGKIHPVLGTYTDHTGITYSPQNCKTDGLTLWEVDTTDLFEALRCDGMNGKKTGQYTFTFDNHTTTITTGDDMKGRTSTEIGKCSVPSIDSMDMESNLDDYSNIQSLSITFEGGLEETMKVATGNVDIFFLEFPSRKDKAGHWGMIVFFRDESQNCLKNQEFVYLTSVVKA